MTARTIFCLALLFAAGAAAQEKGAEINACTLLTEQEVEAAIGRDVDPGLRRDAGRTGDGAYPDTGSYSSTCLWRVAADRDKADPNRPLGGASFVILNAMNWPPGSGESKKFLQSFRDAAEHNVIPSKPVALNIGEEALWWGDGVAVRKGDTSFGISVHLVGEKPAQRGIEEKLAAQIAPRLK